MVQVIETVQWFWEKGTFTSYSNGKWWVFLILWINIFGCRNSLDGIHKAQLGHPKIIYLRIYSYYIFKCNSGEIVRWKKLCFQGMLRQCIHGDSHSLIFYAIRKVQQYIFHEKWVQFREDVTLCIDMLKQDQNLSDTFDNPLSPLHKTKM